MSKAFVKENENGDDDSDLEVPAPATPGGKNYITPQGAEKLRQELKELVNVTRPKITEIVSWAASNGDRSENGDYLYNKKKLREIDKRIRFLTKRLEIAEVVDPTQSKSDAVHFGATVTLLDESGTEKTYAIVGIDETDIKLGKISWISPLGKALLKAKKGDTITFRSPKGEEDLEILSVKYVEIP
jgi:transcription elongation factor GreB